MDLYRLLYVSRTDLGERDAKGAIARILLASQRNNDRLAISGALLYSGTHFAQILEGEQSLVVTMFGRIARDRLHHDVDLIAATPCDARQFDLWTMAYCGTTTYAQRHIDDVARSRDASSVTRLERLMHELVAAGGVGVDDEAFRNLANAGRRAAADRRPALPDRAMRWLSGGFGPRPMPG